MGTRFAGSQHVGDRRRRRLAVESDDGVDLPVKRGSLPAREGATRTTEASHCEGAPQEPLAGCGFPVARIIPPEAWKYLAVALAIVSVNGVLAAAGWLVPSLLPATSASLEQIFSPTQASASKWYGSLLLLLSSQLSLTIWWARSRSSKDFEGRYWLWTRAALLWFAFSGCVAIDAAGVAADVLRHFRPELSPGWSSLAWLIPASLAALGIARPLFREMGGCRISQLLFGTSLACYVIVVAIHAGFFALTTERIQNAVFQSGLLTGHGMVFLSMLVHARHVIHFSYDPAQLRRPGWRIRRPHFQLPKIGILTNRRQREQALAGEIEAPTPKPRRPRLRETDAASRGASNPVTSPDASQIESLPALEPRLEIDESSDQPAEREVASAADPAQSFEEAALQQQVEQVQPSHPDLRGMSKKQRRRIMQEQRDRERAAERG